MTSGRVDSLLTLLSHSLDVVPLQKRGQYFRSTTTRSRRPSRIAGAWTPETLFILEDIIVDRLFLDPLTVPVLALLGRERV